MAMEIEQLIKIILGFVVVIAVVFGIYLVFRNQIADFFQGFSAGNATKIFFSLLT